MIENEKILQPDLTDAVVMSVLHSNFSVPAPNALADLIIGDLIKLCAGGERFWCKFMFAYIDGSLVCRIDNDLIDPGNAHGLKLGDLIHVELHNILEIYYD